MRINTNVSALNAWRNLGVTDFQMSKTLEKLSSGLRINRAADDAAGLAISEKMRAQIRGLNMAAKNALDGISLIQTAEGALTETHAILQRMRELAVQAASDTNTDSDRAQLQTEVEQLIAELDRIATTTEFNEQKLLNGNFNGKVFHVGANKDQRLTVSIANMAASKLGMVTADVYVDDVSVSTVTKANSAIAIIQAAIDQVSTERARLGAYQNRLEHTVANLNVAAENLSAAESRIRDADMAREMMNFVRHQILLQSGTAMLAQANLKPQAVLQLLG